MLLPNTTTSFYPVQIIVNGEHVFYEQLNTIDIDKLIKIVSNYDSKEWPNK